MTTDVSLYDTIPAHDPLSPQSGCDCDACYNALPTPWGWRKEDFYERVECTAVHYLLAGKVPVNGVMGAPCADPHGASFAWTVFEVIITTAAMALTYDATEAQPL